MKNNKGITLVALVVTIVVLLILAGVSINSVLGENGIIIKAKEAAEKTAAAQEKEMIERNLLEQELENSLATPTPKPQPTDGVKIPAGFYYVGGTKTSGIVISDNVNDKDKYKNKAVVGTDLLGNQYVWIPCTTDNTSSDLQYTRTEWGVEVDGDDNSRAIKDELTLTDASVTYSDSDTANGINADVSKEIVVETGKGGRYITKEEALEIFKKAEDNGFVHQITNIDGQDKIFAICNCNVNVCYALRTSQLFNTPNMSRSAYVAEVTKENCVACGRCVEYCPAGAVKLGQKLCTKAGEEVKYPKMPLPSEQKWGPHMWSEDYRDKNRINCYDTGTAPCKTACPAHIAVQGYLKMAAQGRFMDALALIKKENPFPAVCGHVCNRRCEDACTRGTIDEAIAIDEVKKFIAMQDLKADTRYIPKKVVPSTKGSFDEKVAIIGGGPAGLSCAFYLAEKGYKPTVFEKNEKAGGMLVYGIPSFKLEKDVVEAEIDVIHKMGVDIKTGVEVGKDITIDELKKQGYKAFYIAIGCQGSRKAGIPGEDADGVVSAVDFLKQAGYTHEYPLEGDVVVIGGGNVAIDVARTSTRVGDYNVSMFCLEDRKGMPASEEEVEEALEEGVKLDCGWGPKEILTEDGHVTGIVLKRCISVKDADGRFNPQYDENDLKTINCRHVFLSIGQSTIWGELLKGTKVQVDGVRVKADKLTYQTTDPDIFIGGDVYTGPRFAIDAIAAGKEAAISIHRYVQPHSSLTIGRNRREFIELDKNNISIESYDNSSRQVPGTDTSFNHKKSFKDAKLTFTEEQVKKETARCLGCGASVVDPNKCIGCGICTTKCEFDAIHLNRELPECSTMRKSEDKLKYILPYGAKQAIKIKFAGKKNK